MEEITGVETSYHPVDQGHDLECCVAEAVSQGCDCIIGGYSTYLYLKNGPIPVVTIKVSRETIFNVLEEAVHIAEEVKKEKEKSELFRIITQISNAGIFYVNDKGQIEIANPDTLYGVLSMFSSQKWTNKAILNDSKIRDLIEHLSKRKLGNKDYPADLMGDAYEILLKKFADDSKAQAGEFYTPRSVVRLLVHILDPQPGETVYDPACGSGGMLIEAIRYMHDDSLCCGSIFGQEKNVVNAAIAKMNLFLHGASDFNVMQGDTLRDPKILQGGNIAKFNCVIANPPFSLENWGATEWSSDKYKRNIYGTPSDSCGDYAWIQHMICSMSSGKGRMAVVMPQGILFRGNQEDRNTEAISGK